MALSIKPKHLKRYKDIALLLVKHGRADWVRGGSLETALGDEEWAAEQTDGDPEALVNDLESLGPTFVKLGQMLSTRPDLMPPPYLDALTRLQDQVAPFSYAEVEAIVEEELGVRMSKAFEQFDYEPLAAASLGQVHRATLRDGKPVVVKVQRPGIRETILEDLEALGEMAGFLDQHTETGRRFGFADMLAEFRKTLLRELDYRQEAENLLTLRKNLERYERLLIPAPITDYTTARVLTMDYVHGKKITQISPLARVEVDGEELARDLSRAYLDQILVDGFFHADPHPGNVFLTDDHRLALLDLGMVARFDPQMQEELLKLLLAISEGRGREVAEIAIRLGTPLEHFDEERYKRRVADLVATYQHATLEDIKVGRIVIELARIAGDCGVRPAPELTMLGKTLLQLDDVARCLAPRFDPNAVVREHADSIMQQRMLKGVSPGNVFSTMLEANALARELPARLNTISQRLADNEFQLKIDAFDERRLLDNLHKIANRLSLSIVVAALVIGAALMMRVETTFRLFGYPGIAMIFFLLAAASGFYLLFSFFFRDEKQRRAT